MLHRGTEEARRNESSFLALDTTTKTNLLHALRVPGCPLRGRKQIFSGWQVSPGACFRAMQGGALMTLLLALLQCLKTFGSNAEGRTLFFLFVVWVFAEMSLLPLASFSNICPVKLCLFEFLPSGF